MSSLCPPLPGSDVAGALTTCEGRKGGAGKGLGKAEAAAPGGSRVLSLLWLSSSSTPTDKGQSEHTPETKPSYGSSVFLARPGNCS